MLTVPAAHDTSPTGNQYTQGLTYEGYGTLYLDIIHDQIAASLAKTQTRSPVNP